MQIREIITFVTDKLNQEIRVSIFFNNRSFDSLNNSISNKYMSKIKREDIRFSLLLKNDLENSIDFAGHSIYVNSQPITQRQKFSIKPDEEVSIKTSDVLRDKIILAQGLEYFRTIFNDILVASSASRENSG